MDETRLQTILDAFPKVKILVIGDYFLDCYLTLERNLSEISLETGLEAYQVVEMRKYPGAAGTVAGNLRSLDVNVVSVGVCGNDGNGYDLRRKLAEIQIDPQNIVQRSELFTPTYNKPMMREADGVEHELNRLDVKNRQPLTPEAEQEIIKLLRSLLPEMDGVLVVDQVKERNCGVLTNCVREEIQKLAAAYSDKYFIVDSRDYAGLYENVIIKTNLSEAIKAAQYTGQPPLSLGEIIKCCRKIYAKTGRPIIITRGDQGAVAYQAEPESLMEVPTFHVSGPIDVVGAGDSVNASMGAALCSGASLEEAVLIGNLTASLIVQQIGVTGTTTRSNIMRRFHEFKAQQIKA
jgi:rfaE bifunctional protein kinase chain/domain